MEVTKAAFGDQPTEKKALQRNEEGFWKTVFGPFARKEFWVNLCAMIAMEAAKSFVKTLGATLIHYIDTKATKDTAQIQNIANARQGAGSAFSGGAVPTPQYRSSYSPAHAGGGSIPTYQGFGN